jgi:hypothetical protein
VRQKRKLDQLRDRARAIEAKRARAIRATLCVGLELEEILELVIKAIRDEYAPVMETVFHQIDDYDARTQPGKVGYKWQHGFIDWLVGLQDGIWSLPAELPEAWLVTWRDGYEPEFSWDKLPWTPRPHRRCEGCRLALPCVGANSKSGARDFEACPACGGTRISGICFYDMRKFTLDGKTDFF